MEALDNWYDDALKQGLGFKSEEERQEYLDSLGDPMKHPMFATSTEDLEGSFLAEGIRALREEDKTDLELCIMYKEEGNEWIKKYYSDKADKKNIKEAYDRYTHALTFIQKEKTIEILEESLEINKLASQVLSNRAQCSLLSQNFRDCIQDCNKAIPLWSDNMKAFYRKSKALHSLRYHSACHETILKALEIEPNNKDLLELQTKNLVELQKKENQVKRIENERKQRLFKWKKVWDLSTKLKVTLGYNLPSSVDPLQIHSLSPTVQMTGGDEMIVGDEICWPILAMYPQYNQFDVIEAAPITSMIAEQVAALFPEPGDSQKVEWDYHDEYHISNLVVYIQLNSHPSVRSLNEWIYSCEERNILHGHSSNGAENTKKKQDEQPHLDMSYEKVLQRAKNREKQFQSETYSQSNPSSRIGYLEIHLGCTIQQILSVPSHVIPSGIMRILMFPRSNAAHNVFLAEVRKAGFTVETLHPTLKTEKKG